jgi:hypothetical protein
MVYLGSLLDMRVIPNDSSFYNGDTGVWIVPKERENIIYWSFLTQSLITENLLSLEHSQGLIFIDVID